MRRTGGVRMLVEGLGWVGRGHLDDLPGREVVHGARRQPPRRAVDGRVQGPRNAGEVQQGRCAPGRRPCRAERPRPRARHVRRLRVLRATGREHREGDAHVAGLVRRAPPEPRRGPVSAHQVQARRHHLCPALQLLPRLPEGPQRHRPLQVRRQRHGRLRQAVGRQGRRRGPADRHRPGHEAEGQGRPRRPLAGRHRSSPPTPPGTSTASPVRANWTASSTSTVAVGRER